ncbi:MAG TPA: nucleotidyltransferase domain-containing protein [Methanocorpusculum sp.]|nr:nucleotidyltransferase domain-containing protein [Methanocorpusculum sp.]
MAGYQSIKSDVLGKLEMHLSELQERFDIEVIGVFGSVSRGEDTSESDVDILYRYKNGSVPLRTYVAFHEYLEELFQRPVEIISLDFIEPGMRPSIETDMILYPAGAEA